MFLKKRISLPDFENNRICLHTLVWLSILIDIFIELVSRRSIFKLIMYIVKRPAVFVVNVLVIMSVLSLFMFFKRRFASLFILSIPFVIIGITNGILLIFRTTPFTAQDLLLIKYAINMSVDYLGIVGIAALIVLAVALVILIIIAIRKIPPIKKKINYLRCIALTFSILLAALLLNEVMLTSGIVESNYGNIHDAYTSYGVTYCFANTLLNTGIKEPKDYADNLVDDTDIKEALVNKDKKDDSSLKDNTSDSNNKPGDSSKPSKPDVSSNDTDEPLPNIVVVQLESFFDVTNVKELKLNQDPLPFFHYLSGKYTSGHLSMPSVGAGTANSEFEVITGMNIDAFGPGEYPYKTVLKNNTCESYAYSLGSFGYSCYAIHNNEGTFYDRNTVYPKLGFSCFVPIEYMYDLTYTETGWAEDKCLTRYIDNILSKEDNPAFIYTVSVQGHGAYPDDEIIEKPFIDVKGLPDPDLYEQYKYYVNQLYEMDSFIRELVKAIEESGEKTILVLFGDHLPGLELSDDELKTGDMYLTDYVIWDNCGFTKEDRDIQAYQLLAYACQKADIHEGILCRFHQRFLDNEINEEDYLKKLDSLEYDMLYGDKLVYGGENPFDEIDMSLGIYPISISEVNYKNGYLYIAGDNFNEYSVVTVDNKQIETIYISSHLLVASLEKAPEKIDVSVSQVGRDHVVLGSTDINKYTYRKKPDVPDAGTYE